MDVRVRFAGTLVALSMLVGACASAAPTQVAQPPAPVTQAPAMPTATAGSQPTAPSDNGGYGTGTGTGPTAAAPAAGSIAVADSALGKILVDGHGMTLYIFTKDTTPQSTCYGGCAKLWPPEPAVAAANVGSGIDASLLGTTTRTDGTLQETYKGMPLYLYTPDTAPGDTTGEGVGGVWYVISPTGDIIK